MIGREEPSRADTIAEAADKQIVVLRVMARIRAHIRSKCVCCADPVTRDAIRHRIYPRCVRCQRMRDEAAKYVRRALEVAINAQKAIRLAHTAERKRYHAAVPPVGTAASTGQAGGTEKPKPRCFACAEVATLEVMPPSRQGDREPRWYDACDRHGQLVYRQKLDPRDAVSTHARPSEPSHGEGRACR